MVFFSRSHVKRWAEDRVAGKGLTYSETVVPNIVAIVKLGDSVILYDTSKNLI